MLAAIQGDITRVAVDAIVNAANEAMQGGGGVDGAIHRAAGPELVEECRKVGRCPTGRARLTKGYRLPAKYVIHTVGPVWQGGGKGEERLLESCYRNVMKIAHEKGLATLAFPAISTGRFRFPMDRATEIAVRTVHEEMAKGTVKSVTFVCFDTHALAAYQAELGKLTPNPASSRA